MSAELNTSESSVNGPLVNSTKFQTSDFERFGILEPFVRAVSEAEILGAAQDIYEFMAAWSRGTRPLTMSRESTIEFAIEFKVAPKFISAISYQGIAAVRVKRELRCFVPESYLAASSDMEIAHATELEAPRQYAPGHGQENLTRWIKTRYGYVPTGGTGAFMEEMRRRLPGS